MRLCAEWNVLLDPKMPDAKPPTVHVLIPTDTWLGVEVARLICDRMRRDGMSASVDDPIDGMNASDAKAFNNAVGNFAGMIAEKTRQYRGYTIIFNLTGGLKGFNNVIHSLATVYGAMVVYKHETGVLIKLPALPMTLEPKAIVEPSLRALRRLELDLPPDQDLKDEALLIEVVGDSAAASMWGKALFESTRDAFYSERILEVPSERVVYGPRFLESAIAIAPNRIKDLNVKIDMLVKCVEMDSWLSGVDLKPLKGNALTKERPSTHEIDAWHDGAACRIFLHKDGVKWVLDKLGNAYH